MGLDASDVYAGSLLAAASAGLVSVFVRRAWAWRFELWSLLAASLLWAGFLVIILRSDAVGHDCSEPHHEGELPMLIVTLVWAAVLVVAIRQRPNEMRASGAADPVPGHGAGRARDGVRAPRSPARLLRTIGGGRNSRASPSGRVVYSYVRGSGGPEGMLHRSWS